MALDRVRRLLSGQPTVDQDFLRACSDMGSSRVSDYRLYGDMYDGEHRTRLTSRQKAYLEAAGVRWAENFIETCVDIVAERLNVTGFEVMENEDASTWLTERAWQGNRMDAKQGVVNTQTMVKGDYFVIVGVDEKLGLPSYKLNRPELIKPVYCDDGDEMLHAVKRWASSEVSEQNPKGALVWRLNIYYPDRAEKYFSADKDGEVWERYSDDGDESWPVWWTDTMQEGGEPLGIPVIHFRNKPLGNRFGRSEVRGLIPFQQALAKGALDLFEILDTMAWPRPWGTGIPESQTMTLNPGEFITATDAAAKFGQLTAADPTGVLAANAATLHRMATKGRVPIHLLMLEGALPSGESLKTANAPLVKKSEGIMVGSGNSYEDMQRLGWHVASVFGGDDVPEFDADATISTVWDSAEDRDEVLEATTYEAHQRLGVSKSTILRKLGYDPDEEKDARSEEAESALDAAAKAFNAGGGMGGSPVPPPPKARLEG